MPAESSIKQYTSSLSSLAKRGFTDLSNTDAILEAIKTTIKGEPATKNTMKNILNALIWKLGKDTADGKIYHKAMVNTAVEIKESATYTATDKSVPWSILGQIYKKYEGQDRKILAVYSLFPPRRLHEFASMMVVARKPRKPTGNYLVLHKKSASFVFGEYKTKDSYGVQTFPVPHNLFEELETSEIGKPLFQLPTGLRFADTQFSTHIGDLTSLHIPHAIRAAPTSFRHSFITNFLAGNPTTLLRQRTAAMMGHAVATQMEYDQR